MTKVLSLELQGFKSFAHKTKLIFKDGLNVVVGPNGSGKSNIMDALCFVMGKTKKREMRAERLSHLIFNGGKGKKSMDFAKVVLTLENNGEFPIKSKEVRISRVVNKDGNSVFRINGIRANLAEIVNLLREGNIDTEGFNIILQGEINKFVDLSNVQRRQIIDDVSGVSIYEEKKRKTMDELDKVEEKTKGKRIILAEKEKYLKELLKDKEYAEQYLKFRDEIRLGKAKLIFKRKDLLEKDNETKMSEINVIEKKKLAVEKRIDEGNKAYGITEKEIEELEEELGRKGQEKERELRDKIEKTAIDLQKSEGNVENYSREIDEISQRLKQIISESKENHSSSSEMSKGINRVKKEIKSIESIIEEKKDFTSKYSPFEIKKRVVVLERDVELLERRIKELKEKDEIIKKNSSALRDLTLKKENIEKRLKNQEDDMRNLGKKADEIDEYLKHLHKQKINFEIKLRNFMSSLSRGTKAIMNLKHPGIIGNIMELIEFSENMSQAINSLAGGRRNIIVVDTEDTAIWCINHLKRERLGTATFIPMSRIFEANLRRNKAEGVIARAIDVVKYDPKFKKVAQWLLGDALIIRNLEVSKKIKDFRMVTSEGDLVERSGVFRGGYRRNIVGPNKAEIDDKLGKIDTELKRYNKYMETLERDMENKRKEIFDLGEEIRSIERDETEHRVKIENAGDIDLKEIIKKEMEFEEKKDELEELLKIKEDEEFERISKEISDMQEKMNSLLVEENTFRMKIEVISNENDKLEKIKNSLEKDQKEFAEMLSTEETNMKSLKKHLSDMKKEQEKFFSRIKGLYEKRSKMKKKLDILNKKINEEEKRAYKFEQDKQKIELAKAGILAKIEGLKKEYEDFEDIELTRVYEKISDIESKINSHEKKIKRFGPVNMKALETYNDIKEEYDKMIAKIEMLEKERENIINKMEEIEKDKEETFMAAFNSVRKSLEKIYSDLAEGDAKMVLENPESPFEAGMELVVRPMGKRFVPLRALSGGEKTIVAIAFILAIQEFEPAPFYIFDEIDSALDKINSQKLANTLDSSSDKSQMIVITHNDEVVASAHYLYGVSINNEGISKVVSIELP